MMVTYTHEWLCQQIVERTPDAIIFADHEGLIRLWNAGAEAVFGHAAGEAIGQSLDLIIPERLRDRHWEGYRRVMNTGETKYGAELLAVPGVRKDGSRTSLEFSVALLRDVTTRWQQERELRERLAALERRSATASG